MKLPLKRRADNVFVDVDPPESATLQLRATDYFAGWMTATRSIVADADTDDPEPVNTTACRAKLCLNSDRQFTADSKHCQKRAGCILRKDDWNEKDHAWLEIAGDAVCLVIGTSAAWLTWILL